MPVIRIVEALDEIEYGRTGFAGFLMLIAVCGIGFEARLEVGALVH